MTMLSTAERGQTRALVVGHDASRAGAQLLLLHLLTWLKTNSDIHTDVLLIRGGELVPDFKTLAPTDVLITEGSGAPTSIFDELVSPFRARLESSRRRLFRKLSKLEQVDVLYLNTVASLPLLSPFRARLEPSRRRLFRKLSKLEQVDVLYLNTVASLPLLPALKRLWARPVICHVHELDMGIETYCGVEMFRASQSYVDQYVAVSHAVADMLVERCDVPPDRIVIIYEATHLANQGLRRTDCSARRATADVLGLPRGAFIVGGCGTLDWRKAPDVFLQVASACRQFSLNAPLFFVWVGGTVRSLEHRRLLHDARRLGIADRVRFVEATKNVQDYFALFDVFLLSSREDPFPLVGLEAAAHGIPMVCFAQSGGMPEFVGEDAGVIVPYLDATAAASAIVRLLQSPTAREALGQRAREKVQTYSIDVLGQAIATLIKSVAQRGCVPRESPLWGAR